MGSTNDTTREIDLDSLVSLNNEHTTLRKELLSSSGATHNLKQDRNGRRHKDVTVNTEQEGFFIECESEIENVIGAVGMGVANYDGVMYRVQVGFDQLVRFGLLRGRWSQDRRTDIPKNRGINAVRKGRVEVEVSGIG